VIEMTVLNFLICPICKKPVNLTVAKTNGDSMGVHDEAKLLQADLQDVRFA
jgi:uncharacterized protein YbaR (Trm112 family)